MKSEKTLGAGKYDSFAAAKLQFVKSQHTLYIHARLFKTIFHNRPHVSLSLSHSQFYPRIYFTYLSKFGNQEATII